MSSPQDIYALLEKYSENKLVIVLASALATVILTKLLPYLGSKASKFITWIGGLLGGRLAFRGFEQRYLDWVITELKELKLTGIVAHDTAKKPQLEQVFVSLRVGTEREDNEWDFADLRFLRERWLKADRGEGKGSLEGYLKLLHEKWTETFVDHLSDQAVIQSAAKPKLTPQFDTLTLPNFPTSVRRWRKAADLRVVEKAGDNLEKLDSETQLRKIISDNQRIAILGMPGAGKTTLLQYIALAYARERAGDKQLRRRGILKSRLGTKKWRLPLFIPLVSVAAKLAKGTDNDRFPSLIETFPKILPPDLHTDNVPEKYLTHQLEKGNCVVLLDGLDEVPTDHEFKAVVRAIESLALRYKDNQFIITSRIAGWRSGVNADFKLFYVNDLTDEQVNTFIDSWYSAVERNAVIGRLEDESTTERTARERRASQRANELKLTLRENTGVRRLATNPMLLSIIALVHRSLATLPKERSKLYDQCTKTLLEQWDISRGVRVDDTNLKLEQKQAIMRRLAIAFHTGEIGDKGGGREAPRDEVEAVIKEFLPSVGRSEDEAHHLLQRLIERSGIITERRRDILAFAHHTFQEYFTAQYLAIGEHEEHQKFLLDPARLMSDWWREVVLLYAGLLSDTSDFIELINAPEVDDLCKQRLRTALLCLGESVKVSKSEVRHKIMSDALNVRMCGETAGRQVLAPEELSYLITWAKTRSWYANAAIVSARQTTNATQHQDIIDRLEAALNDPESVVRRSVVDAVPSLPLELISSELAEKLRKMIDETDESVRISILRTLGKIDKSEKTLQLMVERLNEENESVSRECIEALKQFGPIVANNDNAVSTVSFLILDENHRAIRRGIQAFPLIAQSATPEVVSAFLENAPYLAPIDTEPLKTVFEQNPTELIVNKTFELIEGHSPAASDLTGSLSALRIETARRLNVVTRLMNLVIDDSSRFGAFSETPSLIRLAATLSKLSERGLNAEVAEAVSKILDNNDPYLRSHGLYIVSQLPPSELKTEWVPKVIEGLDYEDQFPLLLSMDILLTLHTRGLITNQHQVIQKLSKLTGNADKRVRNVAHRTCEALSGDFTPQTLKTLLWDLSSRNHLVKANVFKFIQLFPDVFPRRDLIQQLIPLIVVRSSLSRRIRALLLKSYSYASVSGLNSSIVFILQVLANKETAKTIFEVLLPLKREERWSGLGVVDGALIETARHLPSEYLLEKVSLLLRGDEPDLRLFGLRLLNRTESTTLSIAGTDLIIEVLDDKDPKIRLEALALLIESLRTTATTIFRQALLKRLEDENEMVRDQAWMFIAKYHTAGNPNFN